MSARTRQPAAEEGSLTIWMLGLCVALLTVGGLSLDLWRAFLERRELAAAVDAAAVAGASAVDQEHARATGETRLVPARAAAVACDVLRDALGPDQPCDRIAATPEAITVGASGAVELTLLKLLLADQPALEVAVTAVVEPQRGRP